MSGVGIEISTALSTIHNLLLADFAGTEYLLGAIALLIVLMWIRKSGGSSKYIIMVGMSALIIYLSLYGYLPEWIGPIVTVILGIAFAMKWIEIIGKR